VICLGCVIRGATPHFDFLSHAAAAGILRVALDTGVPTTFEVGGVQYVAVQSGWGVDAQGMLGRIDKARGTDTVVPQGGVVWVFALRGR